MEQENHEQTCVNETEPPISAVDLKDLGYSLGALIRLSGMAKAPAIFEVLNEDGQRTSFCFFQEFRNPVGKILPEAFEHYMTEHGFDPVKVKQALEEHERENQQ